MVTADTQHDSSMSTSQTTPGSIRQDILCNWGQTDNAKMNISCDKTASKVTGDMKAGQEVTKTAVIQPPYEGSGAMLQK